MRRGLGTVACAVLTVVLLAGASAWADPSGGGTQRWSAGFDHGGPAFSNAVALSPDGSTVFVTGSTAYGPSGHFATLAYDASTGRQDWVAEYPGKAHHDESGRAFALAVSPDGSTVFVTGYSDDCPGACGGSAFEGFSTVAYDASTGARLWLARIASSGGRPFLAVSPDGSQVFVAGGDGSEGTATVAYDSATGDQSWVVHGSTALGAMDGGLAVSPDGSTLYVAETAVESGSCYVAGGYRTVAYDTSDGTPEWSSTYQLTANDQICGMATDLGLSPDGSTVYVTGYGDGDRRGRFESGTVAYDAETGVQLWARNDDNIRVLAGDTVVSLGVSPDGSKVFVLGNDCRDYPSCPFATLAYDTSTGDPAWVSRYDGGGRGYATDLAVSPDGSSVFITGQENMPCFAGCAVSQANAPLVAYDTADGDERWATNYVDNLGQALAVSPDGSSVYLAGTFTASASTSKVVARGSAPTCSASACGYSTARYNTSPGPGTLQDPEPSLRYDGWRGIYDKTAVGGAYRASNLRGDIVTFTTPKTTTLSWLTHQGPNQGKARITIDGRAKGTFNLYSAHASAREVTFSGLAQRSHTVKLRVLGKKAATSTGTWVGVDGFTFRAKNGIAQESSPQVRFGAWTGVSARASSGGSYRTSGNRSAKVSFDFSGRTLKWITATGPDYGRAKVTIDGKSRTVDLYRRTNHRKVAISFTGLSMRQHHVVVRPLNRKDRAASSTNIVIDAFVVRR